MPGLSPAAENVDAVCHKFEVSALCAHNCVRVSCVPVHDLSFPLPQASSIFFIARRKLPDGADMVYFSVKTMNGVVMLAEVGFRPGTGNASISIKANQPQYVGLLGESIQKLIRG